jgi:hypothetical protein
MEMSRTVNSLNCLATAVLTLLLVVMVLPASHVMAGDAGGDAVNFASPPPPEVLWAYNVSDDITDIAVGDLNGDGNEDVVAIDWFPINATLHVLHGQDGSSYWSMDFDGLSVAVGDVDGDGTNEVVSHRFGDPPRIHLFSSNGASRWLRYVTADVTDIEVGDVDGDGVNDIIACDLSGRIYVIDGMGNDITGWPKHVEGENFVDVAIGQLDGLAGVDVAAISMGTTATLFVYDSAGVSLAQIGIPGRAVEIGDVDGDGINEIVAGTSDGYIRVYRWTDTLAQVYEYFVTNPVTDIELGDLDGDLQNGVEVACITTGFADTQNTLYALDIDSEQAMWSYPMSWSTDYFGESLAIGDVDRDYRNEVVACSSEFVHMVYAFDGLDNNGDGVGDLVWTPYGIASYDPERRITDLEIGDLDGDGDMDVVFGTTTKVGGWDEGARIVALACFESKDMTATGSGIVYFDSDPSTLRDLTPVDESVLPEAGKPNYDYPHGFFSFEITGLDPGQTATVTVTLPYNAPVGTKWVKCHNGVYYVLDIDDDDGDNVITIQLTDGVIGQDDDEAENGTIVDDGGPGYPAETLPPVGGEAYPISSVSLMAPWIALGVILAAGGCHLILRRAHNWR